jgi:hypothetical protein
VFLSNCLGLFPEVLEGKKLWNQMAHMVSHWPLAMETSVQSQTSPCGICDGQSGIGKGFSLTAAFFPCAYHSTHAPYSFIHLSLVLCNLTAFLNNTPVESSYSFSISIQLDLSQKAGLYETHFNF